MLVMGRDWDRGCFDGRCSYSFCPPDDLPQLTRILQGIPVSQLPRHPEYFSVARFQVNLPVELLCWSLVVRLEPFRFKIGGLAGWQVNHTRSLEHDSIVARVPPTIVGFAALHAASTLARSHGCSAKERKGTANADPLAVPPWRLIPARGLEIQGPVTRQPL